MSWHAPIDAYCERTDASFWSEPVTAVSNAAFLLVAAYAFLRWRRAPPDWPVFLLILVVAVIGIGSFLFHTFANRWSKLADVLPITLFIYGYFGLAMHRFLEFRWWRALALVLGFAAFNFAFVRAWLALFGQRGMDLTNGSVGYFPAAIALFGVGAALLTSADRAAAAGAVGLADARRSAAKGLLLAGAVFVASLVFRSIDLAVCDGWPLGTHFLWHLLNATVLWILLETALSFRPLRSA